MLSIYPACFFYDNDGYSVIFPDLNYLATQGETLEEAMRMAVDCLAGYLYRCQKDGDIVPPASALKEINPKIVAKELECADINENSFVNLVAVDVSAYAREHFAVLNENFSKIGEVAETF